MGLFDDVLGSKANDATAPTQGSGLFDDVLSAPESPSYISDIGKGISTGVSSLGRSGENLGRSLEGGFAGIGNNLGIVSDQTKNAIDEANVAAIGKNMNYVPPQDSQPTTTAGKVAEGLTTMAPAIGIGLANPLAGAAAFGLQGGWQAGESAVNEGDNLTTANLKAAGGTLLNTALGGVVAGGGNKLLSKVPVAGKLFEPAAADTAAGIAARSAQGAATMAAFTPATAAINYAADAATGTTQGKDYNWMPSVADLATGALMVMPHAALEYVGRNKMPVQATQLADGTPALFHKNGSPFSSANAANFFIKANNLDGYTVNQVSEKSFNPDSKTDKPIGYAVQPAPPAPEHVINPNDNPLESAAALSPKTVTPDVTQGEQNGATGQGLAPALDTTGTTVTGDNSARSGETGIPQADVGLAADNGRTNGQHETAVEKAQPVPVADTLNKTLEKNQEPSTVKPLAESQALATSEPSDVGVAPNKVSGAPVPKEQPKVEATTPTQPEVQPQAIKTPAAPTLDVNAAPKLIEDFVNIAKTAKNGKDFVEKSRTLQNVPIELSQWFRDKYDPEHKLLPVQAADKFIEDVRTGAYDITGKETQNALSQSKAGSVLQRQPEATGTAGSERGRVEQSVKGNETTGKSTTEVGNQAQGSVEKQQSGKVAASGFTREQLQGARDKLKINGAVIGKDNAVFPTGTSVIALRRALGVDTLPEGAILAPGDKPFKTQKAALAIRKMQGLDKTHEAIQAEGGYVLVPKEVKPAFNELHPAYQNMLNGILGMSPRQQSALVELPVQGGLGDKGSFTETTRIPAANADPAYEWMNQAGKFTVQDWQDAIKKYQAGGKQTAGIKRLVEVYHDSEYGLNGDIVNAKYEALDDNSKGEMDKHVADAIKVLGSESVDNIVTELENSSGETFNSTFFRNALKEKLNEAITQQGIREKAIADATGQAPGISDHNGSASGEKTGTTQEALTQAEKYQKLKTDAYSTASGIFGKDIYANAIQNDWQKLLDALDGSDQQRLKSLSDKYQRDAGLDGMGAGTSGAGPGRVNQARHGAAQINRFAIEALKYLKTPTSESEHLTLTGQSNAEIAATERAKVAEAAKAKAELATTKAEQAAKDKADLEAKVKARTDNPDNFQFGENSKQAAAPTGDVFNQPKPTPAANPETVKQEQPTEAKAKLEDFGQKIEGAKKDLVAALKKEYSADEIASLPLSKIWPADLHEKIEDPYTAAVAFAARQEVPAKPRTSYKVARWVEKVKTLRSLASMMMSSDTIRAKAETLLNENKGLEGFRAKVSLLESIDRSQWKRIGSVDENPNAYSYGEGSEKIPSPFVSVQIDGRTEYFRGVKSIADVIEKVNEKLGVEAKAAKMKFEVRGRNGNWFINKAGDSEYRHLKEFNTGGDAKEALDYKRDHYDDLVKAWESVKERDNVKETDVRGAENRPRTAQDWRKGKDITTEQFSSEFGFRGGQFGNWVSQGKNIKERQGMMNGAYDALMDLSNILGIPTKAISLNGELGMSFGARGSGSASAHYESDNLVINLTKTRGAGTLAHEWFHALDNYFQRSRNAPMDHTRETRYVTYKPEPMFVRKDGKGMPMTGAQLKALQKSRPDVAIYDQQYWKPDPNHPQGVRPEVEAKFADLVNALNESPMKARSSLIDKGVSEGYWSRIIERAARSFENYIITKMAEKGYNNDYLANVVDIANFKRDEGRYPYLKQEELAPVVEAFDNLFGEMQSKETDKGIALFSRTKENGPKFYSALTAGVEDHTQQKATPGQWAGIIKNMKGVKPDEVFWTGVNKWLGSQTKSVTKAELLDYLHANEVTVKDVTLGQRTKLTEKEKSEMISLGLQGKLSKDKEARYQELNAKELGRPPKFDNPKYRLPGGTDYRETLVTLPTEITTEGWTAKHEAALGNEYTVKNSSGKIVGTTNAKSAEDAILKLASKKPEGAFKSNHYPDIPNPVVHIRHDVIDGADGKKYLRISEIQSDWGQKGKKEGFVASSPDVGIAKLEKQHAGLMDYIGKNNESFSEFRKQKGLSQYDMADAMEKWLQTSEGKERQKVLDQMKSIESQISDLRLDKRNKVPSAPFVGKTESWVGLGIKSMVRYAAEHNLDGVVFVNGEQAAGFYDLSKQVDYIDYNREGPDKFRMAIVGKNGEGIDLPKETFTTKELEDYVGKDVAQKMINGEGQSGGGRMTLRGPDLKVGGEGMKAFYDRIVPNVANNVLKQLGGGRVEPINVNEGSDFTSAKERIASGNPSFTKTTKSPQLGFSLTPEMKSMAMAGQPLFSKADKSGTGMPKADIQKTVSDIRSGWKNAPEIVVVDNMNDPAIREAVRNENDRQLSQGATGHPEGFFDNGKVYVVASEIKSPQDVGRVLMHEALGHYGLRGVFGKDLSKILNEVSIIRRADVNAKIKQYGLDATKQSDRLTAAEEVLAEMAQANPQLGFVKRAVAAIRTFLRDNVPYFHSLKMTDDEIIRNFIIPSRSFVQGDATSIPSNGKTAFERDNKENRLYTVYDPANKPVSDFTDQSKALDMASSLNDNYPKETGQYRVESMSFSRSNDQTAGNLPGDVTGVKDKISEAADKIKNIESIKGVTDGVSMALDGIKMAVTPQYRTAEAREVSRQIIEGMGEKEMRSIRFRSDLNKSVVENKQALTLSGKARDLVEKGLTVAADKVFLKQSVEDNHAFMQAMDSGDTKYFADHPDLKGMADTIGKMFDEKAQEVQSLDTGAMQNIRDNYFPHIWNREPAGDVQRQIFSTLAKRPLEGQKGFLKQRVFDDFSAGIKAGFEPISNNPLDIVALKMEEMDKYILAHKTLRAMEKTAAVDLIGAGDKTPQGYSDINGRFGFIDRDIGKGVEKLRYVAREDVAQVINNYLSPSLYHNKYVGKPFTGYMHAANTLNQFQLGVFSAFHAGFTSFESVISHAAIGVKALTVGDFKGAAKYLGQAPAAWINNPKLGSKIVQEMLNKGSHPEMAQIIEGLQMAGFKWQMDNRFRTDSTKQMLTAWQEGNKVKAGLHSINAVVEQSARPILEWLVPRQKFGVFGEMYNKWIEDHPNASHEELRNSAQQIWNRVDSRLGQVVYDRLFVHNVAKNFTQMLIRAPGWTGGTILEVGGGVKDLAKYAGDLALGRKPQGISDRAAYTLSMLMTTAIANALLTSLFTGSPPKDWKDLVAFRTGNLDEHGRPERFMLPTYMKDVYAYANAPGTTLLHKSHPLLSLLGDVVQNRDYYGTEIRSEDDNLLHQLAETAGYTAKAFVPFWVKGVQKESERGGNAITMGAPLFGVMPAPSNVNKTAAEKLMSEYGTERSPQGSRTQEETDKSNLRREIYVALRKGDKEKAMQLFQQGKKDGILTFKDYLNTARQSRHDPLVNSFSRLTFDQAQRVMDVANADEKTQLRVPFLKKQMTERRDEAIKQRNVAG